MKICELDENLNQLTKSEQFHLANPGILSPRYNMISRINVSGQEMYEFSFDSMLKTSNISIMKESRYTEIPLHRHKVIEINYVYSGRCTQIINGEEITLETGDVCLLDRNTPHSIKKMDTNDIVFTIDMRKKYFTDGFLERLSSQGIVAKFLVNAIQDDTGEKQYIIFRTNNDEDLYWTFQRMLCEYFDLEKSDEVIDAYMIIFFSRLLKIFKQNNFSNYAIDRHVLIVDILKYIETNYMTTSLTEAASHFNFNSTYFGNYIKKHTGKTFKELIINKKMTTACYYLTNTDIPIYQIAKDVGYENLGFFYKKFKERYGVNPQEYKDRNYNV